MELDKRIVEGKRPLTCFDLDEAEEYVGKKCYISNEYDFFRNLDFTQQKILNDIEDCETPFHYDSDNGFDKQAEFCLPAEWVKEPEKKYRPYTLNEFAKTHNFGKTIIYRYKGTYCDDHREAEVMYLGYVKPLDGVTDEAGKGEIVLGNESLGLQNLFDNYEMWVDGEWQPFGVLDEEKE